MIELIESNWHGPELGMYVATSDPDKYIIGFAPGL
jgi:hypothetical protein